MPKLYPEALAFCVAWVVLAMVGWNYLGFRGGLALSIGLFLIVMPASAVALSKTGNFVLERVVRWSILAVAAIVTFSVVDAG